MTVAVTGGRAASGTPYDRRRPDDFGVEWYSGSGAGGQHRNRHMNSCRLKHLPTGIVRTAQTRSRENSHAEAMAAMVVELDRLAAGHVHGTANAARRDQVGSGERSDRRRTWAFQRDLVEDFVTGRSMRCRDALAGRVDRLW